MIKMKIKNLETLIELDGITVIVGPNNSGKSLLIGEISHYIGIENGKNEKKIIQYLKFDYDEIKKLVDGFEISEIEGKKYIFVRGQRIDITEFIDKQDRFAGLDLLAANIIKNLAISLRAENRAAVVSSESAESFSPNGQRGVLSSIVWDENKRQTLRKIVRDNLGLILAFRTNGNYLQITVAKEEPWSEACEIYPGPQAYKFHESTNQLRRYSDGVKFFIAIFCHIIAKKNELILIDEPEAFLAPPLARRLGNLLGKNESFEKGDSSKKTRLIAATHSADFLMGCLESKASINVIRLTYSDQTNQATADLLSSNMLKGLMKNPIIKHAGFLKALFYPYVIICEADSDRMFYEEINERLINEGKGIKDCLFLNSPNGKDKIPLMVEALVKTGIKTATIIDFDVIKGNTLSNLLSAYNVSPATKKIVEQLAKDVKRLFENEEPVELQEDTKQKILNLSSDLLNYAQAPSKGLELKSSISTQIGSLHTYFKKKKQENKFDINNLSGKAKEDAKQLLSMLASIGIFVVPYGQLEDWRFNNEILNVWKENWLNAAFEKLGDDPSSPAYLKPNQDEIWGFINGIGKWFVKKS